MLLILADTLGLPPGALLHGLPTPRERKPPTHSKTRQPIHDSTTRPGGLLRAASPNQIGGRETAPPPTPNTHPRQPHTRASAHGANLSNYPARPAIIRSATRQWGWGRVDHPRGARLPATPPPAGPPCPAFHAHRSDQGNSRVTVDRPPHWPGCAWPVRSTMGPVSSDPCRGRFSPQRPRRSRTSTGRLHPQNTSHHQTPAGAVPRRR
jgi:hypothetical protein